MVFVCKWLEIHLFGHSERKSTETDLTQKAAARSLLVQSIVILVAELFSWEKSYVGVCTVGDKATVVPQPCR